MSKCLTKVNVSHNIQDIEGANYAVPISVGESCEVMNDLMASTVLVLVEHNVM